MFNGASYFIDPVSQIAHFFHFLKMSSYSMKQLNLFFGEKGKMYCKTGLYTIYSTFFLFFPQKD